MGSTQSFFGNSFIMVYYSNEFIDVIIIFIFYLNYFSTNGVSKARDLNELNIKIIEPKKILRCLSVNFCMELCSSVSKNIQTKCMFIIVICYKNYMKFEFFI